MAEFLSSVQVADITIMKYASCHERISMVTVQEINSETSVINFIGPGV